MSRIAREAAASVAGSSLVSLPIHALVAASDVRELRKMGDKHAATALAGMVGATDSRGRTAVHLAALSGDVELLRTVLKLLPPADVMEAVNVRDSEGATPLFLAAKLGSKHCMRELVKGHVSILKELMKSHQDLGINSFNKIGISPLQAACAKGAVECAKLMLAHKADPTLVKGGDPPLMCAVVSDNAELVEALLHAGADVGQPSATGQTIAEIINPRSEIYKIIKQFLINRPGGVRKLQVSSEECLVATKLVDLTIDVLKHTERSGLTDRDIEANWPVFCKAVRLVTKKVIVATPDEANEFREKPTGSGDKERWTVMAGLASSVLTAGDPRRLYRDIKVISQGSFGVISAAITTADKRPVAIKRLPHNSLAEKAANLREAHLLKECAHRNIVAFRAAYECTAERELWLTMDLIEGCTFDEIATSGDAKYRFEERHVAFCAGELFKALEFLHSRMVMHRDVRTQNVMLTATGDVRLVDFGSAVTAADTAVVHTDVVGSPLWMAPEMILRAAHGPQVDVWGAAVCVVSLANFRLPDSSSLLRSAFSVGIGHRPWLDRPDNWSEAMVECLDGALQSDATKRASAASVVRHRWVSQKACGQPEFGRIVRKLIEERPPTP